MHNVGSRVSWFSQGGGTAKRKEGEVVEVVPANTYPVTKLSNHVAGAGKPRNHDSFVVLADSGEKYWPIASKLHILSTAAGEYSGAL